MPDDQSELVALNFVFPDSQMPLGELNSINIAALKKQVKQVLAESGVVTWAVLGFDISLNVGTQRGLGIYWQPQLCGPLLTTDHEKLSKDLKVAFPKSDFVSRPVRMPTFDGSNYAASYGYKTDFVRRVSYRSDIGKYECWQTRKVRLKAREHVELLLALDQWGFRKRLLTHRIRLLTNEHRVNMKKIE